MVFSETIQLEDGVSPAAKAAQKALADMTKGLESASTSLFKAQALGDDDGFQKAATTVNDLTAAIAKLKETHAALLAEGQFTPIPEGHDSQLPMGASTPIPTDHPSQQPIASIPADFKASAEASALAVDQLKGSLASAQTEMAKAAAMGDAEGFNAAKDKVDEYEKALAKLPVVAEEIVAKPIAPALEMPKDADGWRALTEQIKGLQGELKAAETEMLKMQMLGDGEGFKAAKEKADSLKGTLAKLPPVAKEVEKDHKSMWEKAADAAIVGKESIGAACEGIKNAFTSLAQGDVKGAVAGVTDAIAGMATMLDLVVPGLGQAVSAVIKLAGGLVGVTAGLIQAGMEFAIESAQGKQAALAMWEALGQGVTTGEEVDEMLSDLADSIGISKDKLGPLTTEFLKMGVTGTDALEELTLAAISANAIVGEGGAAAYTNLQKKMQLAAQTGGTIKIDNKILKNLGEAGLHVGDLAEALGVGADELKDMTVDATKLGDAMTNALIKKGQKPLERMGQSFGAIKEKFMQDLGDMFEDIDIGPFMKEVKDLFAIFGQANPSGQALKAGIMGFFKETFAIATKLVPIVKNFFLDMIIFGLKAYIALKPIAKQLQDFFTVGAGAGILSSVLDGLKTAFIAIGGAIALIVGLVVGFVAIMVTMNALVGAAIGWLLQLGASITSSVIGAIQGLVEWFGKAPQLAMDFIMGLVNGITGGAGQVAAAVGNVAQGAVGAFKNMLGISSPSKVMAGLGGFTAEGFAEGVEGGAGDVAGAASTLSGAAVAGAAGGPVAAPAAAAAGGGGGGAGAAAGGGGGGTTVILEPGAISISGQGKDWAEVTEEMIAAVMERLGMQIGVA